MSESDTTGNKAKPDPSHLVGWTSGGLPIAAMLPREEYLAAIVAHELSNPFTALAGRVDLMRSRKDLPTLLTRDLEAMRSASERIDRILSNLKTFSRREMLPPRPIDVWPVVQSAVEIFRKTELGSRVEVSLPARDESPRVIAVPTMLELVIAATLESLASRSSDVRHIELRAQINQADEELGLLFVDQGPEVREEAVSRIYHPFSGTAADSWESAISLSYGYYMIRVWGGSFRFRREKRSSITEISLAYTP